MAALLVGHGLIHAMGPVEIWGVADLAELTGAPSVALAPTVVTVLAVVWLVALAVLVAAGWAEATRRRWWRPAAMVGVVVSQLVIIVVWGDAATGTIPNLLIVAGLLVTRRAPAPLGRSGAAQRPSTRTAS